MCGLTSVAHTLMLVNTGSGSGLNSPLRFARFEFKYILPQVKRDAVEEELQYFLQYDPFVVDRADHQYVVRSLYYDDPLYSAFADKVDGQHSRYKFRLRTYTRESGDEVPLFLEKIGRAHV